MRAQSVKAAPVDTANGEFKRPGVLATVTELSKEGVRPPAPPDIAPHLLAQREAVRLSRALGVLGIGIRCHPLGTLGATCPGQPAAPSLPRHACAVQYI